MKISFVQNATSMTKKYQRATTTLDSLGVVVVVKEEDLIFYWIDIIVFNRYFGLATWCETDATICGLDGHMGESWGPAIWCCCWTCCCRTCWNCPCWATMLQFGCIIIWPAWCWVCYCWTRPGCCIPWRRQWLIIGDNLKNLATPRAEHTWLVGIIIWGWFCWCWWSGIRSSMLWIHHAHNVARIVLRLHYLATLHHLHTNKKHSQLDLSFLFLFIKKRRQTNHLRVHLLLGHVWSHRSCHAHVADWR